MSKFNRLIILALLFASSLVSCSSTENIEVPNIYKYDNDTQFSFYAYAPPGNGYYTVDGYDYPGKIDEDGNVVTFQTVEKYQEYKDCGFDTIMIQADDAYFGEDFETSHVKNLMDMAHQVGLKTIIFDNRLYVLSNMKTPIVGEGYKYQTQEELEEYVRICMKDYSKHESFIGLLIKDEPSYENLPAIGSLFKAVKKVSPDTFVQCNLFPLSSGAASYYMEGATASNMITAYKSYLETFLEETKSDYIMADSYPMKVINGYNKIDPNHIKTIQMLNDAADKYDAKVYAVAQTSAWKTNGIEKARLVNKQDMYWQTNFYMGMGVKQISYFTYQTKKTNSTGGEYFNDAGSFIKWNGNKTKLYDDMKDIHKEMQSFASTVLNFDLKGINYYKNGTPDISYLSGVNFAESFIKINEVTVSNNNITLVSEMYDKNNDTYMYMIFNPNDPSMNTNLQSVTISFNNSNAVVTYKNGVREAKKINKSYKVDLYPGEAVYLIPFSL